MSGRKVELVIPQRGCGALLQEVAVLINELSVNSEALHRGSWACFGFKGHCQHKLNSEINFLNLR